MNKVIGVLVVVAIAIITITGVYTVTSSAIDSTDEEVKDSSNKLSLCMAEGAESENCILPGTDNNNGGN